MKIGVVIIMLLGMMTTAFGQEPQQEVNDPKATALLKKVKAKYESYKTIKANFTFKVVSEAGGINDSKTGDLFKKNGQYRVQSNEYDLITDKRSAWLVMKNDCQVNISNVDEDAAEVVTPSQLLDIYKNEAYLYAITGEATVLNKPVYEVEFKPKEYNEDITKLRASISKSTNEIIRVIAFTRYGGRFTFTINNIQPNVDISDSYFVFNQNNYTKNCGEGIEIIDMRE